MFCTNLGKENFFLKQRSEVISFEFSRRYCLNVVTFSPKYLLIHGNKMTFFSSRTSHTLTQNKNHSSWIRRNGRKYANKVPKMSSNHHESFRRQFARCTFWSIFKRPCRNSVGLPIGYRANWNLFEWRCARALDPRRNRTIGMDKGKAEMRQMHRKCWIIWFCSRTKMWL